MTKETLVFVFGILLAIVPFLGVPEHWRQYTIMAIGFVLIFIGYLLRRGVYLNHIDKGNGERENNSFVETTRVLFDDSKIE